MSYRAQITNLSMRHDTTLPPTPKTNPQISIKSIQTDPCTHTHTHQIHQHRTNTPPLHTYTLHRHPNILSELLWHPVHMCDVAAVSLKIKLGYSDLTVCSAKLCINAHTTGGFNDLSCFWKNALLLKRIWGENCSHKSLRIWLKTLDMYIKKY